MDWISSGISWARVVIGVWAVYVQFRIFRTSRSGTIRNADTAALFSAALLHSALWAVQHGGIGWQAAAMNFWMLVLASGIGVRLLWAAYAKYLFAVGAFFVFSGNFSSFLLSAVFLLFLGFLLSASRFYLRNFFAGGLAGFLKKHFREKGFGISGSSFDPMAVLPHLFVLLVMFSVSREIRSTISGNGYASALGFSVSDAVIVLSVIWFVVSWAVFSFRKAFVTNARAKFATGGLLLATVVWSFVDWSGSAHFFWSLVQAFVFYAGASAVRSAFSFYARSDGAVFVDYRSLSSGEIVDTKFLSSMLYDYQYDTVVRDSLVRRAKAPVDSDWTRELVEYVDAATESAKNRNLNGFVARTEVLVHRKVTVVPHIATAFVLSYATLPDSPAHLVARTIRTFFET